jgi:hypothetical protein
LLPAALSLTVDQVGAVNGQRLPISRLSGRRWPGVHPRAPEPAMTAADRLTDLMTAMPTVAASEVQ